MNDPLMTTVLVIPVPGGRLREGAHPVRRLLSAAEPDASPAR